jgi:hypothetical protein
MTQKPSTEHFSNDEHLERTSKDLSVIKDGVEVAHIHKGVDWQSLKSKIDSIEEAAENTKSLSDEDREYINLVLLSLRLMKKDGVDEGYLFKVEVLLSM